MRDGRTAVIKIGGSILRDETSYRSAAHLLVDQIEREPTWAVVSAAHGMTDALETLAQTNSGEELRSLLRRQSWITGVAVDQYLEAELRETAGEALPRSRDRLLAWGERASVAALQTHLEREGVSVPIVELEEGAPPARRRAALVPGFYLRDRTGGYRCLPRGGSDISAMLVAAALGTDSVCFWKEGGGIRADQGVLPEVDPVPLLGQLSNAIRPLHPVAVQLAIRWGIDMILEDPFHARPATRVRARTATARSDPDLPYTTQRLISRCRECEWQRVMAAGLTGG